MFLLGLAQQYFTKKSSLLSSRTLSLIEKLMLEKTMGLDYTSICDPSQIRKYTGTEEHCNYNGDISSLIATMREILKEVLSSVTAFALLFRLCFAHGTTQGLLGTLTAPLPSLLLTLLLLGGRVVLSQAINARLRKEQNDNDDEHVVAEQSLGYMISDVFLNIPAGKVVRLYSMEGMLKKAFHRFHPAMRKVFSDMIHLFMVRDLWNQLLTGLFSLFAYGMVLLKVLAGAISIGAFAQYVGALTTLQFSLSILFLRNEHIRTYMRYLYNYLDFLAIPSAHTGTIPVEKRLDHVYELEFHHVSFAYPGSQEYVLKDVSCKLDLKEKMAVVGPNGAGKTTFIKLLTRLYDPTEGYITLNGVDIRKYDYDEYLSLFSVVFQDYQLFPNSIGENVAANRTYDRDRVWTCLRQAGVADHVRTLEQGLDTPLDVKEEGGADLSGGEAQKVAIARALYKDAPLVILDEPTAALDPLSEYEIYSRFDQLVADKTSVYISHRMSSCRFCTDILVFRDGQIIQRGSHEQLVEQPGLYSDLWNAQAKYYKE